MLYRENLLRNEFFPSELPPCFSTSDLADNAEFIITNAKSFGRNYSIPLKYSGFKSESSRRKFAIPNPYHYCKAVDLIVENCEDLELVFAKSKYSLTAPLKGKPPTRQAYLKRSKSIFDTKNSILFHLRLANDFVPLRSREANVMSIIKYWYFLYRRRLVLQDHYIIDKSGPESAVYLLDHFYVYSPR